MMLKNFKFLIRKRIIVLYETVVKKLKRTTNYYLTIYIKGKIFYKERLYMIFIDFLNCCYLKNKNLINRYTHFLRF